MPRPNEMEPALIDYLLAAGPAGATLNDAEVDIPNMRRMTPRALSHAAKRLVGKGVLVRRYEYFRPNGTPFALARQYRYWHVEHAPRDVALA